MAETKSQVENEQKIIGCCLITKWKLGEGEVPVVIAFNGKESEYKDTEKTKHYKYYLKLYGDLKEEANEAYLVYSCGEYYAYHPKAVFPEIESANKYCKYWNDDAGIMATGEFQMTAKVKVKK